MKCPVDQTELRMMERQGVEIDYCPQCRGVWLDRGELDKIIERSETQPRREADEYPEERRRGEREDDYYKRRKKRSFLGDLFDFD